jgi:glycerophosphoryl diester phosphodiesterase
VPAPDETARTAGNGPMTRESRPTVTAHAITGNTPRSWSEFRESRDEFNIPLVIAHRGTPRELPENTLASFSRALEQGADVLETDLRISQDGVIVLVHDETLERTTNGTGFVSAHSLDEIKDLRTRAPAGQLADEGVPTLLELLALTQAQVPLLLELKDPLFAEEVHARKLVRMLQAYEMLDKSAVVSFKSELVRSVERVCPELPAGSITLTNAWPAAGTALLGPAWPLLIVNPLYVAWAHRMGSIVAPLDTSPEKRMWYYLSLGVDAVLADSPKAAISAIEKGGR